MRVDAYSNFLLFRGTASARDLNLTTSKFWVGLKLFTVTSKSHEFLKSSLSYFQMGHNVLFSDL